MLGLEEGFVVARRGGLQAVQQGRVGPIDPQQLALPNAVVQGAGVEIRERLLGHDGAAEPLLVCVGSITISTRNTKDGERKKEENTQYQRELWYMFCGGHHDVESPDFYSENIRIVVKTDDAKETNRNIVVYDRHDAIVPRLIPQNLQFPSDH